MERGSSVLLLGPAGTGKSLLAITFIVAAAKRGERIDAKAAAIILQQYFDDHANN